VNTKVTVPQGISTIPQTYYKPFGLRVVGADARVTRLSVLAFCAWFGTPKAIFSEIAG
ncbi:MAG: hypothetical protein JST12_16580, partial [Armatimonadetes bacterium]|nr:hypothetical protein [Armatimonadota bacterium]